jgi:hypothetical protein
MRRAHRPNAGGGARLDGRSTTAQRSPPPTSTSPAAQRRPASPHTSDHQITSEALALRPAWPIEAPRAGNRGGNTALGPGPRRVGRLVAGGASAGALVSAATGGRDAAATTNTAAVGAWVRCAAARARQEVCRPIFDENPYRLC